MKMKIDDLMPSQLYISDLKLRKNRQWLNDHKENYDPIPIIQIDERIVMTDGHTRALILSQMGLDEVNVKWDEDELDLDAYKICLDWCLCDGILSARDLDDRVVSAKEYQSLWINRCQEMHRKLKAWRDKVTNSRDTKFTGESLND